MLVAALFLALAPLPVRAELVEAPFFSSEGKNSPSTSSGRTEGGKAQTPIDAERAFAADAQTLGQWTAFAKWSTDDAVIFVPQPTNTHEWLKDRTEPARAVRWQPIASYMSCDGKTAVNTGAWQRPDGSVGYFTTVWAKKSDGQWRWVLDSGDALTSPRRVPDQPIVWRAACTPALWPVSVGLDINERGGISADQSLRWVYRVKPDGGRSVAAVIWNGVEPIWVIDDNILPPK